MKGLTPKQRVSEFGRKAVAFFVLVCFCAATLPLPVTTFDSLQKGNSQPFPCQSSPCGCKTAEQCWSNCCCKTPAERFAWAEKNGVTPPSYAIRPTSAETTAIKKSTGAHVEKVAAHTKSKCCEARKSCCEKNTSKTVYNPQLIGSTKPDCSAATVANSCTSCDRKSKYNKVDSSALGSSSKRKVVVSMFALKCQGKSSAFSLLPWTILTNIPNVAMLEYEYGPAHHARLVDPVPVFLKPDTPPPKQMLS